MVADRTAVCYVSRHELQSGQCIISVSLRGKRQWDPA